MARTKLFQRGSAFYIVRRYPSPRSPWRAFRPDYKFQTQRETENPPLASFFAPAPIRAGADPTAQLGKVVCLEPDQNWGLLVVVSHELTNGTGLLRLEKYHS